MGLYDPALDELTEDSRQFNQLVAAFTADLPGFDTPEGLAVLREGGGAFSQGPLDTTEVRRIPGLDGDPEVAVRVLAPSGPIHAVYLDIHGGGWCIGSAESGDVTNQDIAEAAGVVVVSVDYRLAPEHPWPAGPDDCFAAAQWVLEHAAAEFGTDRLLIGGASAGAHLAAATLVRVRDEIGSDAAARFAAANLIFGAYDLSLTPSARHSDDLLVIPRATLDACTEAFLPDTTPEQRRDPRYSPLYADLRGLPPALFTVGTLDPLLDDSLFMAARWQAAGNHAELAVYPESVHGFPAFPTELGRHAKARIADFVCRLAVPVSA